MATSRKKRKQRAIRERQQAIKAIFKFNKIEYEARQELYSRYPTANDVEIYSVLYFQPIIDRLKTHEVKYLVNYYSAKTYYGAQTDNFKEALNNVYLERLLDLDSVT